MSQPSRVPAILAEQAVLRTDPFRLVDVGVSGGLHEISSAFAPNLIAVGFDALKEEIERLIEANTDQRVCFEWASVGTPDWTPLGRGVESVYSRSTAAEFGRVTGRDYVQEVFNKGVSPTLAEGVIAVDDWIEKAGWRNVDFLKIDTDGHDLGVIRSATAALAECLAVLVETPFDGVVGPDANTFWNIASELRDAGFHLFDLSTWRFSKAALPMPFLYEIPAQTTAGQVHFGDALFLRDFAVEARTPLAQVLKVVGILDHFGLHDCAVELLTSPASAALVPADLSRRLELALGQASDLRGDPADARRLFAIDPSIFMPSRVDDLKAAGFLGGINRPEVGTDSPAPQTEALDLSLDGATPLIRLNREFSEFAIWGDGWHIPEDDGTWSMGTRSLLRVRLGDVTYGAQLELEISRGFERPSGLDLALVLDDVLLGVVHDVATGSQQYRMPMPESLAEGCYHTLELLLSDSWIPLRAGVNDDPRDLGVFVRSVGIVVSST